MKCAYDQPVSVLSSRGCQRRGLTLVEAVASLVLLGTTITTLLVAHRVGLERLKNCDRDIIARQLAQELWMSWEISGPDLPSALDGAFEERPGWTWSRRAEPLKIGEGLFMMLVSLEVINRDSEMQNGDYVRVFQWLEKYADEQYRPKSKPS